jgi:glycosyltransferase involved in cell wall biosynthesis
VDFNKTIIVDSSQSPDQQFLEQIADRVIYTPNVKLGWARQEGLLASSSTYVFFLDDDITVEDGAFDLMMTEIKKQNVAAVSGKVVYGFNSDDVLFKLFSAGKLPRKVHSAGFVLMERKPVLAINGYNRDVHWGEDMDLAYRLETRGLTWVGCEAATCYHEATFKEQIIRSWLNGKSSKLLWLRGKSLLRMFGHFFGKTFVMPVYYCFKTREPRVLIYYFAMNLVALFGFGLGLKNES